MFPIRRDRTGQVHHLGPGPHAALAIARHEDAIGLGRPGHGQAGVQQIDEEVVGQGLRAVGEHAQLRPRHIGAQDPQAADQNSHLRRGQGEQLGAVKQYLRYDPRSVQSAIQGCRDAPASRLPGASARRCCPRPASRSGPARRSNRSCGRRGASLRGSTAPPCPAGPHAPACQAQARPATH